MATNRLRRQLLFVAHDCVMDTCLASRACVRTSCLRRLVTAAHSCLAGTPNRPLGDPSRRGRKYTTSRRRSTRRVDGNKVTKLVLPLGEYANAFARTPTLFAYQQPGKPGCWHVVAQFSRAPSGDGGRPSGPSDDRGSPSGRASAWRRAPSATASPPQGHRGASSSFLHAG